MPVTSPLLLTDATDGFELDQLTTRPVSTPPVESFVMAESCTVWPTWALAETGLTLTEATGIGVTVTTAESVPPPGDPAALTLTLPVSEPAL